VTAHLNSKKLSKKLNHMLKNIELLTKFQTLSYQNHMTSQISMASTSPAQFVIKDHAVPATLCHLLKFLNQDLS